MSRLVPRPTPLRDAAAKWSKLVGLVGGLLISLVTAGILSTDQATALGAGLTALDVAFSGSLGLITAVVGIAAAFRTAIDGEPQVTPLVSPMNDQGQRLVPETPAPPGGHPGPQIVTR